MARRKKADAPPLTQERLHALFTYDPETGFFLRRNPNGWQKDPSKPVGNLDSMGYVYFHVDGVRYRAHRLAWFYMYGVWPEHTVDHRRGNRSDNRIEKLRKATYTENCRNGKLPKHNTSGFKGATRFRKRWAARIKVNKKCIHLGMFDTAEEAHKAYCDAAQKMHGEFWNPGSVSTE